MFVILFRTDRENRLVYLFICLSYRQITVERKCTEVDSTEGWRSPPGKGSKGHCHILLANCRRQKYKNCQRYHCSPAPFDNLAFIHLKCTVRVFCLRLTSDTPITIPPCLPLKIDAIKCLKRMSIRPTIHLTPI